MTTSTAPAGRPVDTFVDPAKIIADATIDEAALNDEFIRQPGLMFFYIAQHAKAERQLAELKLRLEATEAQVATNVRTKAVADGEKLTADMVKERVRLHSAVVKIEQQLIAAKEVDSVMKGVCEAMRQKKDMLLIKGYMTRDELKARMAVEGDPSALLRDRDRDLKDRLASRSQS